MSQSFSVLFFALGLGLAQADQAAQGPDMVPAGQWQLGLTNTWQLERFRDTFDHESLFRQEYDEGTKRHKLVEDHSVGGSLNSIKLGADGLHLASLSYGLHRRLTLSPP